MIGSAEFLLPDGSIVPLDGMSEREDGGDLTVPYDAEVVRDAPSMDPDAALDEAEQERLARHYRGVVAARPDREGDPERNEDAPGDREAEMIRSEEEVVTGTTPMQPSERVRLRKVLVTENVTRTVPVRREEIRLETDPPPEGNIESVEELPPEDDRPQR